MHHLSALLAIIMTCAFTSVSFAADTLKLAVLKFGTVNWELNTIQHNGFDTANGFTLEIIGLAGKSAAMIAFQGGEADIIVSDWIWVARQRAAGKDYVFIPYSKSVGGLVVAGDSPVRDLSDLPDTAAHQMASCHRPATGPAFRLCRADRVRAHLENRAGGRVSGPLQRGRLPDSPVFPTVRGRSYPGLCARFCRHHVTDRVSGGATLGKSGLGLAPG